MSIESTPAQVDIDASQKWMTDFYASLDSKDLVKFADSYLTPDVEFNFANMPSLKGRDSVVSVFGASKDAISSMKHEITECKVLQDSVMAATTLSWTFVDGSDAMMKAWAILRKEPKDKQATSYSIYGDFAPLYAAVARLSGPSTQH
ncbi:hypothetical protein CYLTODRAFT_489528 [Cylindrobasidium torrendii FP15055 ss-10]|uniref:SnoaL-like domain-containing protein n=1 Tax=Cylindrobasidium torrendii FP15055 ss-10 TaxID=1314674 RepID=A0A0D7BGD6_9AGAR|nr:hypothetical protein CYLTODRAFT_489528 [Cylindrobasidium torrendii FP15055 ss-10]